MLLVLREGSQEEIEKTIDEVKNFLKEKKVQEISVDNLGKKKLFHPKKKQKVGCFYLFQLQAEPSSTAGLVQDLKLNSRVLNSFLTLQS